jgi:hypothetical protein
LEVGGEAESRGHRDPSQFLLKMDLAGDVNSREILFVQKDA